MSVIPTTQSFNVIRWTADDGFESFTVKTLEQGHQLLDRLMQYRIAYQGATAYKRCVQDLALTAITEIEIQRPDAPDEQYWITHFDDNDEQQ